MHETIENFVVSDSLVSGALRNIEGARTSTPEIERLLRAVIDATVPTIGLCLAGLDNQREARPYSLFERLLDNVLEDPRQEPFGSLDPRAVPETIRAAEAVAAAFDLGPNPRDEGPLRDLVEAAVSATLRASGLLLAGMNDSAMRTYLR